MELDCLSWRQISNVNGLHHTRLYCHHRVTVCGFGELIHLYKTNLAPSSRTSLGHVTGKPRPSDLRCRVKNKAQARGRFSHLHAASFCSLASRASRLHGPSTAGLISVPSRGHHLIPRVAPPRRSLALSHAGRSSLRLPLRPPLLAASRQGGCLHAVREGEHAGAPLQGDERRSDNGSRFARAAIASAGYEAG
jgi:hypothetical protein